VLPSLTAHSEHFCVSPARRPLHFLPSLTSFSLSAAAFQMMTRLSRPVRKRRGAEERFSWKGGGGIGGCPGGASARRSHEQSPRCRLPLPHKSLGEIIGPWGEIMTFCFAPCAVCCCQYFFSLCEWRSIRCSTRLTCTVVQSHGDRRSGPLSWPERQSQPALGGCLHSPHRLIPNEAVGGRSTSGIVHLRALVESIITCLHLGSGGSA